MNEQEYVIIMNVIRIIKILTIIILTIFLSGQAFGWHRHWHEYDRFNNHYRHSNFRYNGYPGHHYEHWPQYTQKQTVQDGWRRIKTDRSDEALEIFEGIASSKPTVGEATLGVAVAAADTGDLDRSTRAMRRVLKYNPAVFRLFQVDDGLLQKFVQGAGRFQGGVSGMTAADTWFMRAAFHYLLRDMEPCLEAVRLGRKALDNRDSSLNLYFMAENDRWRFQPK